MNQDYMVSVASQIAEFKRTRESYKLQFWVRSKSMNTERRKRIKKIFKKIDRLRNHMGLWLKHLVTNKPSNHDSYVQLIERGKAEITSSFSELDKALYQKT